MMTETRRTIYEQLIRLQPEYTADSYAETLNKAIRTMASESRNITRLSERIAGQWANNVNSVQREQFYKSIQESIGVNLNGIIADAGIQDIMESSVAGNVNLIQSLPDEYYKNISTIINDSTTRKHNAKSIIEQLEDAGIKSKNRAKLIARDQTSKLNAALTQTRQENLGIEEYVWQTAGDERTRASHRAHNGKTYRWDKPPKDTGHPGEDVNCRCNAIPIINVNRNKVA